MTLKDLNEIVQTFSPILTALFGVGGFAAYWEYKSRAPKSNAEAIQVITGTEISVGDAWNRFSMNQNLRFEEMQKRYDDLYNKYEELRAILINKNDEVAVLKNQIIELNKELTKYTGNGNILKK